MQQHPHGTILDRLRLHAQVGPDRLAYQFLHDDRPADERTYSELLSRVLRLAARIGRLAAPGERALLLYPPGLDFIEAFLACLAAGVIAVPANPPRRNRNVGRLRAIAEDARPRLVLTTGQVLPAVESGELRAAGAGCLATDTDHANSEGGWRPPALAGDAVAFLQYTSGSTGSPRGVVIAHDNLMANERAIRAAFGHAPTSVFVNWLPAFHDMGLIGNILQPLFVGFPSVLLGPNSFLQEPARWLRAISEHRATTAGAPNFAYDLCVKGVTEEQKQGLDLSSWAVAYNGAEPVRAETLDRFTEAFAPCGFRREAFFPCYGLAEATLFVSGGPAGSGSRRRCADAAALEAGRVETAGPGQGRWLVGSGRVGDHTTVVAVEPATRTAVSAGRVGELWVSSPAVALGYWKREEETGAAFGNYLANGSGPFLNTGDLGFLDGDEVFVTGRSKDLIIVRGRNIYPQDLEAAVARVLPLAGANGCAAFALEENGREGLGVVVEADRALVRATRAAERGEEAAAAELAAALDAVRRAVADEFGVQLDAVAFVRPGAFPRTSSGKVQRRACRDALHSGTLDVVHVWRAGTIDVRGVIRAAVLRRLGAETGGRTIDGDAPLAAEGLDSVSAAVIAVELEKATGLRLDPVLIYECGTINRLAEHLAGRAEAGRRPAAREVAVGRAG